MTLEETVLAIRLHKLAVALGVFIVSAPAFSHGHHSHGKPLTFLQRIKLVLRYCYTDGVFDDANVQNRKLSDWDGVWQSVYPLLQSGKLDPVFQKKADADKTKTFAEIGITCEFVQDNHSKSSKGVLRGLHFQKENTQGKLVRVIKGAVLDVAVDIRKGSPTYGKHVAVELTEENHRQLFIPRGFAHGFAVLSDEAIFQYKCDNLYAPDSEGSIIWNDPDLAIDWKVPADKVILSEKDKHHPRLKDAGWLFDMDI